MGEIKFRPKDGRLEEIKSISEQYSKEFPYKGLKLFTIYDLENGEGEYKFLKYFDGLQSYLNALERSDTNPFLDKIRDCVQQYQDGQHFIGHHVRLIKDFSNSVNDI